MCLVRHLPVETTAKKTSYAKRTLYGFAILAPVALQSLLRVLKEICATSANSPTNNGFCKAYTISNDKITPTNVSAILVLWRSRAHSST